MENRRLITRLLFIFSFCFLIFAAFNLQGCTELMLFNPPQVLSGDINSWAADQHPAYSSNGRYLAFASDRNNNRDIFLYDLQAKSLVNLPNLNRWDSSQDQPALNADGSLIAYVSNERGRSDVYVYDRQRQATQLLTANNRGAARHPAISGDGRYVAFETSQLGQWHIAIIDRGSGAAIATPKTGSP